MIKIYVLIRHHYNKHIIRNIRAADNIPTRKTNYLMILKQTDDAYTAYECCLHMFMYLLVCNVQASSKETARIVSSAAYKHQFGLIKDFSPKIG